MKAKQHFYALGQRAKAQGVNKQRAVRYFHMEAAPKWAKHAFLAGWEAADTEHQITYRFDELDERAKDRVRAWLTPDYDWWDSVYEMAEQDAESYGITLDHTIRSGRMREHKQLSLWFDNRYGIYDVTFSADIYVEDAWKDFDHPQHAIAQYLMAEGAIPKRVTVKESVVADIELYYYGYELEQGPLAGASIDDLHDVLDAEYYPALQEHLKSKADAFASHVATMLEEEYEYLTSDEYVAETCNANEYVFDEDGAPA